MLQKCKKNRKLNYTTSTIFMRLSRFIEKKDEGNFDCHTKEMRCMTKKYTNK